MEIDTNRVNVKLQSSNKAETQLSRIFDIELNFIDLALGFGI